MKYWTTLAFIIAALSSVVYFQSLQRRAIARAGNFAGLQDSRAIPRAEPAPQPRADRPALTFGGYPCPRDCAEDKAGYRWAAQNAIADPDSCTGSTSAFIEGCRVYAQRLKSRQAFAGPGP